MTAWSVEAGGPVRTVDAGGMDLERFRAVLRETVDLLEAAAIPHVIMGGIAVAALARPRWTHDIDVFLRPDDAKRALALLAENGYDTEETDPVWLFKAMKDDVLVDLIFRSAGAIYFDDAMAERAIETTFQGERIRVAPPEDLLVIKVAAHKEEGGYHWFDALALLSVCAIDWSHLIARSRHAVRRVLSLLVYADGSDIAVPGWAIDALWQQAYGEADPTSASIARPETDGAGASAHHVLRTDPRTCDLDIEVQVHADRVVITGEVATADRRSELDRVAEELLPGKTIDNRTRIQRVDGQPTVEELV
ncbi:MAG: nucleotidyltransferase family protein [Actinobacteria bacterium]|nr:nucleotidyltransferase family protein [Actinomycetota bacterium]